MIQYIACGLATLACLVMLGVIIYGIRTEEKNCKDLIKEIKRRGITNVFIEE